ncbi:MucR family transcriptional regulator [Agrobacterium rhizogenes]|nr:MucR family transcriptional regulator [Rhizobium rhizogenes]NTH66595.1 MucR family transcriptional regulator [Rhizobium rhizogenes]
MKPDEALEQTRGRRTPLGAMFGALQDRQTGHLEQTAKIAAAFVRRNHVTLTGLPTLITSIHRALTAITTPMITPEPTRSPVVAIDKALRSDCISCLECGRKFKALKKHIRAVHRLQPHQYRERWSLPFDYPMVCPDYSRRRSGIALTTHFGRNKTK